MEKLNLFKRIKIIEDEEIDPNNHSIIGENLDLEEVENGEYKNLDDGSHRFQETTIYKDKKSGEFFFEKPETEIERQDFKVEHFVSLLSKGILRSADFIKKDDTFLSRKIDLEKTEFSENGELEADLFLLEYLFLDSDKVLDVLSSRKQKIHNINLEINKEGNFYHYDYGQAFVNNGSLSKFDYRFKDESLKTPIILLLNNVKIAYGQGGKDKFLYKVTKNVGDRDSFVEEVLFRKIEKFLDALNDKRFFEAIVKKSKINESISKSDMKKRFTFLKSESDQERVEEFRQRMIDRLTLLQKILRERDKNN